MAVLRACTVCGRITSGSSRCDLHPRLPRSRQQEQRARIRLLATAKVCALCGLPPTPDNPLTLGHIVSHRMGGDATPGNVQAEHATCNYAKGG